MRRPMLFRSMTAAVCAALGCVVAPGALAAVPAVIGTSEAADLRVSESGRAVLITSTAGSSRVDVRRETGAWQPGPVGSVAAGATLDGSERLVQPGVESSRIASTANADGTYALTSTTFTLGNGGAMALAGPAHTTTVPASPRVCGVFNGPTTTVAAPSAVVQGEHMWIALADGTVRAVDRSGGVTTETYAPAASVAWDADIFAGPDGALAVTYRSKDGVGGQYQPGWWVAVRGASGTWSRQRLTTQGSFATSHYPCPIVSMASGGRIVVAVTEPAKEGPDIVKLWLQDAAGAWTDVPGIAQDVEVEGLRLDEDGRLAAAWETSTSGPTFHVQVMVRTAAGAWTGPVSIQSRANSALGYRRQAASERIKLRFGSGSRIAAIYSRGPFARGNSGTTIVASEDGGTTWTAPRVVLDQRSFHASNGVDMNSAGLLIATGSSQPMVEIADGWAFAKTGATGAFTAPTAAQVAVSAAKLATIARTRRLTTTLQLPAAAAQVRVEAAVSAATARQLGLGTRRRVIAVGARPNAAAGRLVLHAAVTRQAVAAFTATKLRSVPVAMTYTFTDSGGTRVTVVKQVSLKR